MTPDERDCVFIDQFRDDLEYWVRTDRKTALRIFKLVEEDKRAWHAGKSAWRDITDINSASIGIELVNPGHQFGYRAFPKTQINALKTLLLDIMQRHKLPPHAVLAHADIAPDQRRSR